MGSMAGLRGRSRRDITDAAAKLEYDRQAELGDIRPGDLVVVLLDEMEATDQFLSHEYGITFRTSSGALVRKAYIIEFLWFSHVDPFHFDPGETSRTLLFCDAQT